MEISKIIFKKYFGYVKDMFFQIKDIYNISYMKMKLIYSRLQKK